MQDSEGQGRFAELGKGRHHQSTQQRRRARPALSVALELWMSELSLTVPVLGRCSAGPSPAATQIAAFSPATAAL